MPPAAFDAEEPFPVEISRGGTIRVEAWEEAADAPCQGCAVSIQGGPTPAGTLSTNGQGGTFLLRRRSGESYVVFLGDGRSQVRLGAFLADADVPRLDLELPDGGLSGVLLRDEEPAAERVQLVSAADGEVVGSPRTDERGVFDLPFLPPGTYLLTAGSQPLRSVAVSRGRREDVGTVEIPSGSR